jgi:hypothetical protein
MPNQWCNASAATRKAGASLRLTLRQTPAIHTGSLETSLLQAFPSAQIVTLRLAVIVLLRPKRLEEALATKALMCFDHRAYGGFVFHPERRTGTDHEESPPIRPS